MPALRSCASRAKGREYGVLPSRVSTQWPAFSSGAPWWGVPRNTTWRSSASQLLPWACACWHALRATSPPHAVGQHGQFGHGHRPGRDQGIELRRQLRAVVRRVQTRVVAQVDRRVAQRLRKVGAVVMALVPPLQIVHAQAVNQHQQFAGGCAAGSQMGKVQGLPVPVEAHARAQRVVVVLQAVAHHTVEGGQYGFALPVHPGRRYIRRKKRLQPRQACLQPRIHKAGDAPDALVHQPGEPTGLPRLRPPREPQRAQHRLVHALGHMADAGRGLRCQARHTPQVGGAQLAQRTGSGGGCRCSARARGIGHADGSVMECGVGASDVQNRS